MVANCDNAKATDVPPETAAVLEIAKASAWMVVSPEAAAKTFALPMTEEDVAEVPEETPDVLMVVIPISMLAVDAPNATPVVLAIDLAAADDDDMPSATAVVLMIAIPAAVAVDVPALAAEVSKIVLPISILAVELPAALADVLATARGVATTDDVPSDVA